MSDPRPVSASEAVKRALSVVGVGGSYQLGTGDYRPRLNGDQLIDVPWTERESDHAIGADCAGFALSWCWKLRRHRPGYNKGGKFDVEDDVNCNSAIGDAFGARDLFELASGMPKPGDLLCYPSFYLKSDSGTQLHFIGHVGICVGTSHVTTWDPASPRYDLLDVAQCRGPDGRAPGVIFTDGSIWQHHRDQWPKPEHTVYLLRTVG